MSWDLTGFFNDEKVDYTPITITDGPDSTGEWGKVETYGEPAKGLVWNASTTAQYYNITWSDKVTEVLVVNDMAGIEADGLIVVDGVTYQVNKPVNVGHQGDLYVIGLEARS